MATAEHPQTHKEVKSSSSSILVSVSHVRRPYFRAQGDLGDVPASFRVVTVATISMAVRTLTLGTLYIRVLPDPLPDREDTAPRRHRAVTEKQWVSLICPWFVFDSSPGLRIICVSISMSLYVSPDRAGLGEYSLPKSLSYTQYIPRYQW